MAALGTGAMLSDWRALPSPVWIVSTRLTAPPELKPPRAQKKKMKVLPPAALLPPADPNLGATSSTISTGGTSTVLPELSVRNPSSILTSTSSSSSSGSSRPSTSSIMINGKDF